jgi:hypothetical protein
MPRNFYSTLRKSMQRLIALTDLSHWHAATRVMLISATHIERIRWSASNAPNGDAVVA